MFPIFCIFSALFCCASFVSGFSFASSPLSECDNFSVEWTGGTGPYQLLIVPSFGTPRNISIPTSAYSNGRGTYETQMAFEKDQLLVLTMSDSTGFATGGSTNVLTVGASRGGSCNTTDPGIAFPFQLNYALQQCRPFTFEGFGAAAQPVTVWIIVPGGTSTSLQVPRGAQTFQWVANVAAYTSVMFMMTDGRGGQGGASDVKIMGASDDRSCLNGRALSSTLVASSTSPTKTESSQQTGTASAASASASAASSVPISAIAGTVIGSLLFLAVIVTLGLFFLKSFKKKMDRTKEVKRATGSTANNYDYYDQQHQSTHGTSASPPTYGTYGHSNPGLENPFADNPSDHPLSAYLSEADPTSYDSLPPRVYYPPSPAPYTPFSADPFNPSAPPVLPPLESMGNYRPTSPTEFSSSTQENAARNKAAMAGISSYKAKRFDDHPGGDDELPPPNADGVVELPPTYSERRGPSNFVVVNADPGTPRKKPSRRQNPNPSSQPPNHPQTQPFS